MTASPKDKPLNRSRLWLFRLLVALVLPLLLLLMLEGGLRLIGYGYEPTFFVLDEEDDSLVRENPEFAYRFFPEALARIPQPNRLPLKKPAGTTRIMVFGGSAAMGDPEPAYGLSRVLERLLSQRFPEREFEVINAAVTAINSHVVRSIAKDSVRLDADVWVVYMGNNEVNGPFGCGTVFGAQGPPLNVIRTGLAFNRMRLGQWMSSLTIGQKEDGVPKNWGGMKMFLDQQVASDDPRLDRVYQNFQINLESIIDLAERNDTPLVLSTVATNLPQSPPFTSKSSDNTDWELAFERGERAFEQGRWDAAIQSLNEALTENSSHAETLYVLGLCLQQVDKRTEAMAAFVKARDEDTLRFRADAKINAIIRQASEAPGAALVDADQALSEHGPYFHEHVHLTFAGNYQLSRLIAEQVVAQLGLTDGPADWMSEVDCAYDLGLTAFHRKEILTDMHSRLRTPPFSNQREHQMRTAAIGSQIEILAKAMTPQAGQASLLQFQQAIKVRPEDWQLKRQFARLLQSIGQEAEAASLWESVTTLLPHDPVSLFQLGSAYNRLKQYAKAESSLRKAVALRDRHPRAWNSLGICLSHLDRFAESHQSFAKAIALKPDYGEAYLNWGLVLANQGDSEGARAKYAQALANDPTYLPAYEKAGKAFSKAELFDQSEKVYRQLVEQLPDDLGAHLNLALVQLRLQKWGDARKSLQACLQIDPNNKIAQDYLQKLQQR